MRRRTCHRLSYKQQKNMPGVDWRRRTTEAKWREIVEAVQEKGMEQLMEFGFPIQGNILDLVVTNCLEKIVNVLDRQTGKKGPYDNSS